MKDFTKHLNDEEYRVTQQHGTEPAFSGAYWDKKMLAFIAVFAVIQSFFQVIQNMNHTQVGQHFINQFLKIL